MNNYSFLIVRLGIGASMFGHGLVRMPKLNGFSTWMVSSFEKSMLPAALVTPFSYFLPFAELIIGILLLLGLFTTQAAVAGGLVMAALIFGSCMIEHWDSIGSLLLHSVTFGVLIAYAQYNSFAIDKLLKR
ncbi:DoxX family membrane protein [uncultured Chitinophaga sp.]|uniref:DoxX family membrane protein n=1 Tax=uncultured Chitinophaga sp. TaxID=339340 RepID=UPI0025EC866F|nr:DoxX family membrane protein [uncultured Chitinophaga sp.]